jgi:hypothetical protein
LARGSLLVTAALGCDDTDTKGWLVDRTRVLGARIEAKTEPSRAAIAPGEAMRVSWFVGAPNGTGPLSWSYALCPPVDGNFPEPRCTTAPLAAGTGTSNGDLSVMEMDVPASATSQSELLLLAAFCDSGDVSLDAARFDATCSSGAPARLASVTVRLASAGANKNPEMAPDTLLFDGTPMPPPSAEPAAPCDPSAPVVTAGSKHAFAIRFQNDQRETTPEGPLESLLASHVVTDGELDRQYSSLEPGEAAPKDASVKWTAPPRDRVGAGRQVELYVVLRDGRGGAAFERRNVCVRP